MSTSGGREHGGAGAEVDRWAAGREVLRAADPQVAALLDAGPELDPDRLLGGLPTDLWGALVFQVIGQQLSRAAAAAILARLEALYGNRLPTPVELFGTDAETLRRIGLSRAKSVYLHDLAARLVDGRLDLERLRTLDDDAAGSELTEVKGVGRFTADGVLMLALRRPDVWPAADLRYGARSSGSGAWVPRHRLWRWTPSASASGRGGRRPPCISTDPLLPDGGPQQRPEAETEFRPPGLGLEPGPGYRWPRTPVS